MKYHNHPSLTKGPPIAVTERVAGRNADRQVHHGGSEPVSREERPDEAASVAELRLKILSDTGLRGIEREVARMVMEGASTADILRLLRQRKKVIIQAIEREGIIRVAVEKCAIKLIGGPTCRSPQKKPPGAKNNC